MMTKGFTLIELLVVVSIMGLLGTATVGGYRQMQRGMEERGVVDNMTKFVRLAAERAQIDRQPTAVYCWNELLREESMDANAIIVGRAVAIRRKGRLSRKQGNCLIDEFGDCEQFDEGGQYAAAGSNPTFSRLYLMDNLQNGNIKYSVIRDVPQTPDGSENGGQVEIYVSSDPQNDNQEQGRIIQYGYYVDDQRGRSTASLGEWKVGSSYGFEFQSIELPHGYIFGSQYPTSMSAPIREVATLVFDADMGSSTGAIVGRSTLDIYSMRPGQNGIPTAQKVGTTKAPDTQLN